MTKDTVVLIAVGTAIPFGAGIGWLMHHTQLAAKNLGAFVADLKRDLELVRGDVAELSEEGAAGSKGALTAIEALSQRFAQHEAMLVRQTEELKANARAFIDREAAQVPSVTRAICGKCKRVVYRFLRDGETIVCLDCKGRL